MRKTMINAAWMCLLAGCAQLALGQTSMRSAEGIVYRVVETRDVVEPTPACGFNDLGAPNNGRFRIETRIYEEYRDGRKVREWQEDVRVGQPRCEPT